MPYKAGARLPAERASRLGHLEVIKSGLVRKIKDSSEDPVIAPSSPGANWQPIPSGGRPLPYVFAVDGSLQVIESNKPPYKAVAFVKTALLRLDQHALAKVDKESPHPLALRDILEDSALYHATLFPLRNITVPGVNIYNAVREIIYESINDPTLKGEPLETLKWIAYEKWSGEKKSLPVFECPHCERTVATLPYDAEKGSCPECHGEILLTDMLGFHQEMAEDAAPNTIANTYMLIHETLLLFTGIRYFWEHDRKTLSRCLFIKDGPLSIRAQYSKLVNPIRRFLTFARDQNYVIHLMGQEKTGTFADHLQLIGRSATDNSIFVPSDRYIRQEIQHRSDKGSPYGKDTNYGAKVFVRLNAYHQSVLNVPTGEYKKNPIPIDLLGLQDILATLPGILSNRFEGALLPVELANGIASLSTYPSAQILKMFAEIK